MAQNSNNSKQKRGVLKWTLLGLAVIAVAGVVVYMTYFHGQDEAETTSTAKTAQSNYHSGRPRNTNGQSNGNSQGGATDNNGQTPTGSMTPGTADTTSDTGVITVKGLAKDDTVKSGETITGTVTGNVSQVQFRVIDDEVGVIAQGMLKVVNGAFSGTLSFNSRSSTGRVDVFTFDSAGAEANNIEIPVQFK